MTETRIVAPAESAVLSGTAALFGLGMVVAGYFDLPWLGFFGFPMLIFGVIFLATRRPGLDFGLLDSGIDVYAPNPVYIPYERLDSLTVPGFVRPERGGAFEIIVLHRDGTLVIPATCDVESSEIYFHLRERLPRDSDSPVPPSLREHYHRQVEKFDASRVFGFRSRRFVDPPRTRRGLWIALGFIALAFGWGTVAESSKRPGGLREDRTSNAIGGFAGFSFLGGLIATLAVVASRGKRKRFDNWVGAGLVVSPIGLALKQGQLEGKMRWEEITSIQWKREGSSIVVRFPGSEIAIEDVFDESIFKLYDLLRAFWQPPTSHDPFRH